VLAAAACGDHLPAASRQLVQAPGLQLVFAPRPSPMPVGRHFALDVVVCGDAGRAPPARLRLDAEMPAHRHGMNYRPVVKSVGPGRHVAEGLLLHMPGLWRWTFELDSGDGQPPLRLSHDVRL
jgi:hypothetical protein